MEDPKPSGSATQAVLATAFALLQTRLDLLLTELEEEKQRFLSTLAWGAVALLLAALAVVVLAGFVIVLFWDHYRLWAIGGVALTLLAGCSLAAWQVRQRLQQSRGFLSASLAELESDRRALFEPKD